MIYEQCRHKRHTGVAVSLSLRHVDEPLAVGDRVLQARFQHLQARVRGQLDIAEARGRRGQVRVALRPPHDSDGRVHGRQPARRQVRAARGEPQERTACLGGHPSERFAQQQ